MERCRSVSLTWLDGLQDPFAAEALAAVAQLDGLVLTRARARRDDRPAYDAVVQGDLDLDRRIATGV
jgi:hypothetical protein